MLQARRGKGIYLTDMRRKQASTLFPLPTTSGIQLPAGLGKLDG